MAPRSTRFPSDVMQSPVGNRSLVRCILDRSPISDCCDSWGEINNDGTRIDFISLSVLIVLEHWWKECDVEVLNWLARDLPIWPWKFFDRTCVCWSKSIYLGTPCFYSLAGCYKSFSCVFISALSLVMRSSGVEYIHTSILAHTNEKKTKLQRKQQSFSPCSFLSRSSLLFSFSFDGKERETTTYQNQNDSKPQDIITC